MDPIIDLTELPEPIPFRYKPDIEPTDLSSTESSEHNFSSLECKIEHFGSRSENAWFSQFANQHSRFTPLMNNSRYVWKLLGNGKMLIIDSFMDTSSVFKIVSNNLSRELINAIYFEQVNHLGGFILYLLENNYYISTARFEFDQGLLEVDFDGSVHILDLSQRSYSVASIDWSPSHQIGLLILGQQTYQLSKSFLFSLTKDSRVEIVWEKNHDYPNPPFPNFLPLFHTSKDGNLMSVKHTHQNEWSHFKQTTEKTFEQYTERNRRIGSHQNFGKRFNSAWIDSTKNLFIENNTLNVYDHLTRDIKEIILSQGALSEINENLNLSMFLCDGIMLICSEDQGKRKMKVSRIAVRKPDSFTNLTMTAYRKSKNFSAKDSAKLQNCLFP